MILTDTGLPIIYASGIFNTRDRANFRLKNTEIPTPLRTVKEFELELFCEAGGVSFINGTRNPIQKGDILIASPGDKRQSLLHFKALFIHFSARDRYLCEMISTLPRFIKCCDFEKYYGLFLPICDPEPDFDDYSDIGDAGSLIRLLYALKKDTAADISARNSTGTSQSVVFSAVEYIRTHYSEPLSAEILAAQCNLSTSYFYRIFSQVTDLPPNEFIIRTRLAAAQSLLASCDLPLVQVAEKCGFNSQSYFCFCFKDRFGLSPKQFRQKHYYQV